MDESELIEMSRRFDGRLNELVSSKGQNTQFFTNATYTEMIQKVKSSKCKVSNKKPEDYQRLRRFDVMTIGGTEKLIVPVKEDGVIRSYVHKEEIFQILHETHVAIGHGGRNRMEKELKLRYKNITREMIVIYLNLCDTCDTKYNVPKTGVSVSPIISSEIDTRCQVDIIDMQSQEDDRYKFILVYQDLRTKFMQLRPLKSKSTKEVAYAVLDIFTIFGAPSILQSINGREFAKQIVQEVCDIWPALKIVHGKQRHSQNQGSVDGLIQDTVNMLSLWPEHNSTKKWSEGLRFVQLMKNRTHRIDINCSPYEAMFGRKLQFGLKSFSIPQKALIDIRSEEDLEEILKTNNKDTNTYFQASPNQASTSSGPDVRQDGIIDKDLSPSEGQDCGINGDIQGEKSIPVSRRRAEEANSSNTDSPSPSLGPEDIDIIDTHIKQEDSSDTEAKPAKRLKTESLDTSVTHVEESTSIRTVKTEPLNPPARIDKLVTDTTKFSEPHHPAVKQEPLDIPDYVDPSLMNALLPETSAVTVKSELEDTAACRASSEKYICEVYIPEETESGIKQDRI